MLPNRASANSLKAGSLRLNAGLPTAGKNPCGGSEIAFWEADSISCHNGAISRTAYFTPKNYLFQTQKSGPADLDYLSRVVIAPTLKAAGIEWHGWHAFRRGLATNLHGLAVPDIVIQAILRHSDITVTRESYIKRDGVDARSIAAMKALEQLVCNQCANQRPELNNGRCCKL